MINNNKGFTLLELSIVLVIMGFMTVGFLSINTGIVNNSRQNDSREKLKRIDEAMRSYIVKYGKLPCPTKINLSVTDNNFGKEYCNSSNWNGGIRKLNTNTVLVGALPIEDLNLETSYSYDGWGNKFVYAVVEKFTGSNNNLYNNHPNYNENGNDADLINDKFVYSIISNGRNKYGSYYYKGTKAQTKMESTTEDIQNSFDRMENNKIIDLSNNKGFDDIVVLRNRENLLQQINKFDQSCSINIVNTLSSSKCSDYDYSFDLDDYNLNYRQKIYSNNGKTIIDTINGEEVRSIRRCIIECADYGKVVVYSYDFNL